MRYGIYQMVSEDHENAWIRKDTLMDGPRVLFGFLSLWAGLKYYNKKDLGLDWSGAEFGYTFLILSTVLVSAYAFLYPTLYPLDGGLRALLIFNSFIVGFFEEIFFRGFGRTALNNFPLTEKQTTFIGALIFMAWHVQAQALSIFPFLFVAGVTYGLLRSRGVSCLWLGLQHSIFDSIILEANSPQGYAHRMFHLALFLIPLIWILRSKKDRE